ncbi:tetratricopeptide repeat protein [Porphyromonas asaccharolytica]|uniref:tetratricopeptide repeat protein n=1 Tax=Porphyromonas asaccharolytica TaxID=28123 RepID=UPI00248F2D02|nr:tetratricopeptide repeat protein [Porphyromonas asaccharolytica]
MKRIMALLLSLVCLATTLSAQVQDTTALSAQDLPTLERTFDTFSPDLQDALETIMPNPENQSAFLENVQKALQSEPNNGVAWAYVATIYRMQDKPEQALEAATKAITLLRAKPARRAMVYSLRSDIYSDLEDAVKALMDLHSAIKDAPDTPALYLKRGGLYMNMEQYELAEVDLRKFISLAPKDATGYTGLATLAILQEKYEDAIQNLNEAIKLEPNEGFLYYLRAGSNVKLEHYDEAMDDIIYTIANSLADEDTYSLFNQIAAQAMPTLEAKLKAVESVSKTGGYLFLIGMAHQNIGDNKGALEYYQQVTERQELTDFLASHIATAYQGLGDYSSALKYIDEAISLDPTDYTYIYTKAQMLTEDDNLRRALAESNKYLSLVPDDPDGYYQRAQIKSKSQDLQGAIDDYSKVIELSDTYLWAYIKRADRYTALGRKDAATADYRKVIEILQEQDATDMTMAYAYQSLGEQEQALATIAKCIEGAPDDAELYYSISGVYGRMGKTEQALDNLRIALEKGYNSFSLLEQDDDLATLRDNPQYKALMQQYKEKIGYKMPQ